MAKWQQMTWIKLHRRVWHSPSLDGFTFTQKSLFVFLLTQCWWDGESDEGRVYWGDPTVPATVSDLARTALVRKSALASALCMYGAKRIVIVVDGLITVPNFAKYHRNARHLGRRDGTTLHETARTEEKRREEIYVPAGAWGLLTSCRAKIGAPDIPNTGATRVAKVHEWRAAIRGQWLDVRSGRMPPAMAAATLTPRWISEHFDECVAKCDVSYPAEGGT